MKKKIGKITVKHFLNKNLKPSSQNEYPVYVTIWFQNKLTKAKSYWWIFLEGDADPDDVWQEEYQNYMTDESFNDIEKYKTWISKAMQDESEALENIVRVYFEKYGKNIVFQSPGEIIKHSLKKISDIASVLFKNRLQDQFAKSNDVKVISARLMIKWSEMSFVNIYDGLYTICNDGVNQTNFYKNILNKFSQDYVLMKLMYQYDQGNGLRFWNWIDDKTSYEEKLSAFLKSNNITVKEINRFLGEINTQLQAYLSLIEVI